MIIVKTIQEIRKHLEAEKNSQKRIALVPTMGALHEGHLSLIKNAKNLAEIVIVSIFVNKTQFNDSSDYKNYPRQIESDLEQLKNCAVDYVFLPDDDEIFSSDFAFKIIPTRLTNCLCGSARPGHFDGVALIVSKLFNITKPHLAIFGSKDFQQLRIIQKLVRDLNFDLEIFAHEIVRQKDGLALSSRNQRLSNAARIKASNLFKALSEIADELKIAPNHLGQILKRKTDDLLKIGFEKIDYLEVRDEENLELIKDFNNPKPARIFIAAYLEGVRLIDNLQIK